MRTLSVIIFILTWCTFSYSQTQDLEFVELTKSDIENFIENYPKIAKDFEVADLDYTTESDVEAFLNGLQANTEANRILKKYGYSDIYDFTSKTWTIAMGYAGIKMETEGEPAIENAIKEIESNQDMTAEQKKMALQQIEMMKAAMSSSLPGIENEELIKKIKPYEAALDKLFDSE